MMNLAEYRNRNTRLLAMLHGDIHLQAILQIGDVPTPSEIDLRARTAVKLFLDGMTAVRAETPVDEGQ